MFSLYTCLYEQRHRNRYRQWYIVAPLVIIFLFGGGQQPEPAGAAGAAKPASAAAK
jgi:hypothetical protein